MKRESVDLKTLMHKPVFQALLNPSEDKVNKDLRQTTEVFFEVLRCLRFPQQAAAEKKFKETAAPLAVSGQVKNGFWVEAPRQFEEPGILLHARLKDPKALERLQQALEKNRDLVNSLFDIVL